MAAGPLSKEKSEMTVLLWSLTYGSLEVEECDDLDDAAWSAYGMFDAGTASILGAEVLADGQWVDGQVLIDSKIDETPDRDGPDYVSKVCLSAPAAAGPYSGRTAPLHWAKTAEEAERLAGEARATYGDRVTVEPIR